MSEDAPSLVPNQAEPSDDLEKASDARGSTHLHFLRSWAFVLMTETAKDVWNADAPTYQRVELVNPLWIVSTLS